MLDHVFLSVSDIERSVAFYTRALAPLGITDRVDYDGKDGPPGHPDLKGFGCRAASSSGCGKVWPITGRRMSASSRTRGPRSVQPNAAAMAAGATDNGKPSYRLYYDPRYYAGNVFDPDGFSLEFVFKSWQDPKP